MFKTFVTLFYVLILTPPFFFVSELMYLILKFLGIMFYPFLWEEMQSDEIPLDNWLLIGTGIITLLEVSVVWALFF